MSFADLKRKSQNNFQFLQKELEKSSTEKSGADERLWKPELDASGNGYAVIRFLPAPEGETVPWAKVYSHAFQGPGGWFIENCLTTKGDKCPVCVHNNGLWNSGVESDKDVARKQKRKLSYYSNIYVIKDPANPQNEGRVFLYKYGKKIHDKIIELMQPEFEGQEPVNPFDFWAGADFNLRIKKVAGFWNYDSSGFGNPGTLGRFEDDQLEAIYNKMYDLNEFTDAKNFKSYDELKTRLDTVLKGRAPAPEVRDEERGYDHASDSFNAPDITMTRPTPAPEPAASAPAASEDNYSYFDSLANEDF